MTSIVLPLLVIVRLTILDAFRRRILWVLFFLTIIVVGISGLGFERLVTLAREHGSSELEIQLGVSQMLIVVAFMFSFILAMTAAFIGAPAVAADIESGVLLAILARPIGRSTFLVGRWLGLALVAGSYALASGLLEILVMKLASGYGPPDPLGAAGAIALQAILVLTLTLLFSTRLPSIARKETLVRLGKSSWPSISGPISPRSRSSSSSPTTIAHCGLPIETCWNSHSRPAALSLPLPFSPPEGKSFELVAAWPMSTEQVSSPVTVGRIGPATVLIANVSSSVHPCRRR